MKTHFLRAVICGLTVLGAAQLQAQAAEPQACQKITMSDPGWTDINATNGIASVLLDGLGYDVDIKMLSVPIGFQAIANGEIDVFLGNWMPAQQKFIDDLRNKKAVETLNQNLDGAKFTLAVSKSAAEQGVTDFADLADHADLFDKTIYGIAAGSPANISIQKMIDANEYNLGDWKLVESSEQGMLAQVSRRTRAHKDVVFLAWAPHPMNVKFDIQYLSGGESAFGPNYGGAQVYTVARTGWSDTCPNAARFFHKLTFSIDIENEMMGKILDDSQKPVDAACDWIKAHPEALKSWLTDVKTFDGKPGLAAVKANLGL